MSARRTGDESGYSLVELMTVIVIAGVVGTMSVWALTSPLRVQRTVEARANAQQQMQIAAEQITAQVRNANVVYPPATIANGWELVTYTPVGSSQRCVQWQYLNTGELRTRSWLPNWRNTDNSVTAWRTSASDLSNQTVSPPPGVAPFALAPVDPYGDRLLIVDLRASSGNGSMLQVKTAVSGRNTTFNFPDTTCNDRPPE